MEFTSSDGTEASSIFTRLENEINSLKQMEDNKNRELEACNVKLETAKNEILVAQQNLEDKDAETKALKNSLLKEKTENENHSEKINSLTEKLRAEKDSTTKLQTDIASLQEKVQNEHGTLVNEIETLKTGNEKLQEENVKLSQYLTKLGEEVDFQRCNNAAMLGSAELQHLLAHIQEIMRTRGDYTRNLNYLRNEIEAMLSSTTSRSRRTSSAVRNVAPVELNIDPNLSGSQSYSNPVASSSKASSSFNQHSIKNKDTKHKLDTDFNPSLGFRCICGTIVQHKQSFRNHIRRNTEKLKFRCQPCKKAFLHRSGLTKHFQSVKCERTKKQQNRLKTEDKSHSMASNRKQYVHKSIRHRFGYQGSTSRKPVLEAYQEKKLVCHQDMCHAKFWELAELKRHLTLVHHIQDPLSKWGTACKFCGKLLENWDALKRHLAKSAQCASAYKAT